MNLSSFAQTKLRPPRPRPGWVERGRIDADLAAALSVQRLVLICAPAGFGKTAALARQTASLAPSTVLAWLAADADDDLGRFVAGLVAALDPHDLPWRSEPDALVAALDADASAARAVASDLVNALVATEVPRGLIVIDDLHRIDDPTVFRFLESVIERLPSHWGVVLSSRVDPPLPLARWRARGELREFRQDALRFTRDEVSQLVARHAALHGGAGAADAESLLARTHGWAAGLGLVLGSPGRHAGGSVSNRHMFDYLAAEVLDAMPEPLRLFLLRCSVLPELTAPRCAAVSGDARAAAWLDDIERRGLFVSVLDGQEPTLTLHDLFRDCLDDRLHRELPGELPQLLERAAAGERDPVRRIGYLTRAGAWAQAEGVLCGVGPGLVAAGGTVQVLRMLDHFPPAVREASPPLAHLRGLCAWAHWDLHTMWSALDQAISGFERTNQPAAAQRSRALLTIGLTAGGAVEKAAGLLAQMRGLPLDLHTEATAWQVESWHAIATSRFDRIAEPLARTVELLERSDDPMLWLQCVPLTPFIGQPGTRTAIQRWVHGAWRRAPVEPPTPLRVLAHALQGGLQLWAGQVDAAFETLQRVERDSRWLNRPPNVSGYHLTFVCLVHALRGEREAALEAAQAEIDGLDDARQSGRRAVWLNHFLFFKLRVAAICDDDATQREVARQIENNHSAAEHATFVRERATLPARLAAIDGRYADAARSYAQALADDPIGIDLHSQALEVRVRLADALLRTGDLEAAADALRPAFAQVAASGEPAGALFAGPRALRALAAAPWGHRLDAGQARTLQAWAQGPATRTAPAATVPPRPNAAPPLIAVVLSAREREVLERIAAGDSNKLIARAFDLSPHTVKRHVANILDKLGAGSRGQAAAWFRAHVHTTD